MFPDNRKSGIQDRTPTTGKVEYKTELLETKLTYIQRTDWPSQVKRKVSGVEGEQERLMTVLYYDFLELRSSNSKDNHDV